MTHLTKVNKAEARLKALRGKRVALLYRIRAFDKKIAEIEGTGDVRAKRHPRV